MAQKKNPLIRLSNSEIHGKGVYAAADIKKGARVIEYVGRKMTKAQSDKRAQTILEKHAEDEEANGAVYIFELNKRYDIDGSVSWNTARFINHSCDPNCEPEIIKGHIWIVALRDIKQGEELTYNYGYDYDNYKDHPCRCGANNCVGFIAAEDHWDKIKRKLRKKAKKQEKIQRLAEELAVQKIQPIVDARIAEILDKRLAAEVKKCLKAELSKQLV